MYLHDRVQTLVVWHQRRYLALGMAAIPPRYPTLSTSCALRRKMRRRRRRYPDCEPPALVSHIEDMDVQVGELGGPHSPASLTSNMFRTYTCPVSGTGATTALASCTCDGAMTPGREGCIAGGWVALRRTI